MTVGTGKISLMGAANLDNVNITGEETPIETNSWTLSGSTATYGTSSNTLIKLTNIKSLAGVSLSGNVVTIAKSAVNAKKITLTGDDYTLKLASDVTAPTTKKAAWSLNSTTATYKSSYKTAGYTLASNSKSIKYSAATTSTTLAQVKGAKAKPTISNDIIKLKTSTINSKVTLSGSYEFDFASGDYKKAKITGSSSADKITSHGKNISLNGGAGDDTIKIYGSATSIKGGNGADVFVFDGGSGIITDYAAEVSSGVSSLKSTPKPKNHRSITSNHVQSKKKSFFVYRFINL